ncbi:hypothetical protein ACQEVC_36255 [Plantactinospora sp. CA-294935]|uniref:hypothetical protein n=1 Tax=Plantactinospora sp. CA-294935 TaxID=3240012 RepID=UPI003D947B6F
MPKAGNGIAESIRALHLASTGAVTARTACSNERKALVVTARLNCAKPLGAQLANIAELR